ncbi:twin-arginine translocation signal domain-containing protein [bacterium]|nr:twin-arginine translocation signal domain-containing protein [bacterium]
MQQESQSSQREPQRSPRRDFLRWSGAVAAGSALAGVAIPPVHAAEDNTIRLALIGCGGRGGGAVANAMQAPGGPVKLWAMADLFEHRLTASFKGLSRGFSERVDVPQERRFIGFDAYRKAIDCLRPGDIALLTGYTAWRVVHLDYAVKKGVHVFMEKPFAVDPPAVRRMIKAGEAADKKNLKIAAGLMCRHSKGRQELIQRVRDGAMGQLLLIRAYRMHGGGRLGRRPARQDEMLWQIGRRTSFLWASGSLFDELTIHQIDEVCWLKDGWPVAAHGIGGRAANNNSVGQNLDSYAIEYTFADGTKAAVVARYIPKCHNDFATYVHGTKCAAQFSGHVHAPTVRTYKDQRMTADNIDWKAGSEPCGPHQAQWNVLLDAIRKDRPYNETRHAAFSELASIMGRAAVHMGKTITWDQAMASNFQFCSNIDALTEKGPSPVKADAEGRYPVPIPGVWSEI